MKGMIGAILFPFVLVGGMLYYLLFGEKTLEPPVHTELTPEKLRALLAEAYSFGANASESRIADAQGVDRVVLRKVISRPGEVTLRWSIPADVTEAQVEQVRLGLARHGLLPLPLITYEDGRREQNCGDSVETGIALVGIVLNDLYALELGTCSFRAAGISLNARTGWS